MFAERAGVLPLLSVSILCTLVLLMSSRAKQRETATAGRPVDHQRRAELLDAVVDYTVEHGFSDLSWRPVAAALGVSTTTLVHRFGAKEQMLEAILGRLRERMFAATAARRTPGERPNLAQAARAAWTLTSDPQRGAEFRLFFAVYGRALQAPQQFTDFLKHVVADWMSALRDAQGPNTDPATATRMATVVIATIRGLLLDLLATGDRARVQNAAEGFLASLEHPAHEPKRARSKKR
ncbi:MAG: TetR/AcrR family transcriptional regulator [Pseudomonadota bacterium]